MPKGKSLAKKKRDWERMLTDGTVIQVGPNRWKLKGWPEPEKHASQERDFTPGRRTDYAPSDILDAMKEYCKGIRRCPKDYVFSRGDDCRLKGDCYGRGLSEGPMFRNGAEESLDPLVISMLEKSGYLQKRASYSY
jgi:hypothetical protein